MAISSWRKLNKRSIITVNNKFMKSFKMISLPKWYRWSFKTNQIIKRLKIKANKRKNMQNNSRLNKKGSPKLKKKVLLNRNSRLQWKHKRSLKNNYKRPCLILKTILSSRIMILKKMKKKRRMKAQTEIIPWTLLILKRENNTWGETDSSIGDASLKNRKSNTWKQKWFDSIMMSSEKEKLNKKCKESLTWPQSSYISES